MAVFNEPTQWDHTLGNNADTSTLPDDAVATTGIASLQKLFQIINATPLEAGGIAPAREDVNALFKYLGDQIFYTQNGGIPSYNAAYDYIPGRVVLYDNNLYKCIQANGVSSTVVAPDSVSPLGSDYWVQVVTLADFANFANTDLSNLSVSGQALFTNKANKDFSNVTAPVQAFKDMSIGWVMPDYSAKIQITASPFIAPSAGIVYLNTFSTASYDLITVNSIGISRSGGNNNNGNSTTIIVNAGDKITIQNIMSAPQNPPASVESWFVPFKGVVSNV